MSAHINIIGVSLGDNLNLTSERIKEIYGCDVLIGAKRFIEKFNDLSCNKVTIDGDLTKINTIIKDNIEKKIVILASGDPNLYGISDFILRNNSPDNVFIHPNISSMQLAFAAAKISMNEAALVSVHGRGLNNIVDIANKNKKIGIFTTDENTPKLICNALKKDTNTTFDIYICEDLGYPTEKITKTNSDAIETLTISPLNIMILIKRDTPPADIHETKWKKTYSIGIEDSEFFHKEGMLTKSEIRVLDISKLKITPDSIIWDIGAGCGSVSIEMAKVAVNGKVYAIEKDAEQFEFLTKNINKFNMDNIEIIYADAADATESLPSPDRIFIGGSGGRLREVINTAKEKIKENGIIVINAVTLNTLIEGSGLLQDNGFTLDVYAINISRTRELNGSHLFKSTNPIYIISGTKGKMNS